MSFNSLIVFRHLEASNIVVLALMPSARSRYPRGLPDMSLDADRSIANSFGRPSSLVGSTCLHFLFLASFEIGLRIGVPRTRSAETIALSVIPNTYPRAYKGARSNRESVAAL